MYEPVCRPIDVIIHFDNKVKILKFRLKNSTYVYKVDEVLSRWNEERGDKLFSYFTVVCKEQDFLGELQFDHKDMKWYLIQKDTYA